MKWCLIVSFCFVCGVFVCVKICLFLAVWVCVAVLGLCLVAAVGATLELCCAGFSRWWLLVLWCVGFQGLEQAQQLWLTVSTAPRRVGSSQIRDQTRISYISCIGRRILYHLHHQGSLRWEGGRGLRRHCCLPTLTPQPHQGES